MINLEGLISDIELYLEICELTDLGLTTEDIEGFIDFLDFVEPDDYTN